MIRESHNSNTHLANFEAHLLPIYEQAIQESGWGHRLRITSCAERPGMFSLHTCAKSVNHGPFWKMFYTIMAEKALRLGCTLPKGFHVGRPLPFTTRQWLDSKLKEGANE